MTLFMRLLHLHKPAPLALLGQVTSSSGDASLTRVLEACSMDAILCVLVGSCFGLTEMSLAPARPRWM